MRGRVVIAQRLPTASRRRHNNRLGGNGRLDRGAAAVEMAIVLPLLIMMILGIIDFSRVFNAQLQLSQAAREGVRLASLLPMSNTTAITTVKGSNSRGQPSL